MTEPEHTFRFSLDAKASILVLLLLPCLIALGVWQLARAEQKRDLKRVFEQRKQQAAIPIGDLSGNEDLRYRQVSLRGEFVPDRVILLDNKMHKGQFGYEVISPFKLANSNTLVMINRGWVAGDRSRRTVPVVNTIKGDVTLKGEIYVPQGKVFSLGVQGGDGWPRIVQSLDMAALSNELKRDIFPYTVRIHSGNVASLLPNWIVVNVQPEKHLGYAFQWFAMAVALLIIALLVNTNLWALLKQRLKRQKNNPRSE